MSHAETPTAAAGPPPSRPAATDCSPSTCSGASSASSSATRSASAIGHRMASRFDWVADIDQNDISVLLGYIARDVRLPGRPRASSTTRSRGCSAAPAPTSAKGDTGWTRYLRASTDHKVIGLQYLIGIGVFFFIGGLNAMLIRTELLRPTTPTFSPGRVPDARRPARLDDDHDGLEHHPGAVRALLRAAHDRQPGGWPSRGSRRCRSGCLPLAGLVLLTTDHLRRLPHRLDRLPDARRPGRRRHGRVPLRLRPGRHRR